MAKKRKSKEKIILRAGDTIGSMAAEDDHKFLKNCFVDLPILKNLRDMDCSQNILIGRTGSGKSAILWDFEQNCKNVSRLDPTEASFNYLANSGMIEYLDNLGVDLSVFYEYLWKHILCIHIIRECLDVKTNDTYKIFLKKISNFAKKDKRYDEVKSYLTESDNKFWINVEEVARSNIDSLTSKIAAKAGLSISDLKANTEFNKKKSTSSEIQIKQIGHEIVSNLQIQKLTKTIDTLSDLVNEKPIKFYILIDDLEENWGGEKIQYPLIRALLKSLRKFQQFDNLKIIVAIREDIYESTLRSIKHKPFQSDKFDSKLCRIKWPPNKLHAVIDRRLNHLFKKQYEKKDVGVKDVLPLTINRQKISTYLASKTLQRPRDIISFINEIFANHVENRAIPLSAKQVLSTEIIYSRKRIDALHEEWKSCHPNLEQYIKILKLFKDGSTIQDLDNKRIENLILTLAEKEPEDNIEGLAIKAFETMNSDTIFDLKTALLCCLYKVGVLGFKFEPTSPIQYCYDYQAIINPNEIDLETKFYIHPMFKPVFQMNERKIKAA